jgi:hypothetical protein
VTALEVAFDHYRDRASLVSAVAAEGKSLWRQVDAAQLTMWGRFLARLLVVLTGAQRVAASRADVYLGAVLAEQGVTEPASGRVNANMFSGVASDGRPLDSLLQMPVVATKLAIGQGATIPRAMATGEATLDMILRTQVADAGRVADGVAIAARPRVGYVRMLVGDSCPRCAILAGRWYRYSAGFARHP